MVPFPERVQLAQKAPKPEFNAKELVRPKRQDLDRDGGRYA